MSSQRPPFETFKKPTCRGCYALGTACGTCEKCVWERQQAGFTLDYIAPATSLSMTLDEAYELNRYHQAHEKAAAASGDYDKAKAHKERAAEIGGKFWPAGAWERAWSTKNG